LTQRPLQTRREEQSKNAELEGQIERSKVAGEWGKVEVYQASTDIELPRKASLSSSPSRRSRACRKADLRNNEAHVSPSADMDPVPAQNNTPIRSPPSILINESPLAYSEIDTRPKQNPTQATEDVELDDPKPEIKMKSPKSSLPSRNISAAMMEAANQPLKTKKPRIILT
jgi:hypothetical protein